jgi:hypothetical protein
MSAIEEIHAYDAGLSDEDRALCERLGSLIADALPEAAGKVWHGHPVWFIDGNPVVGYHRLKNGVRVLFWSGQSFPTPGLAQSGSFQAAEFTPGSITQLAEFPFEQWLRESREFQWDYGNIMKNKRLNKLTDF